MNLGKIFLGSTKDGEDRLLYKTYEKYDNGFKRYYIDLKTKEKFSEEYVYNLIPFDSRCDKDRMTRRKVLKTYKSDERLILHTDNLFVGDIFQVDWINDDLNMSGNLKNSNKVFIKRNDEYEEIITKKIYKVLGNSELSMGDLCVSNLRNVENVLELDHKVVSKDTVLRKKYLKFNRWLGVK